MREDISSERDAPGWVRFTCNACGKTVEWRPELSSPLPDGWAEDLLQTPATTHRVRATIALLTRV